MNVYKVTLMVIDHDQIGAEGVIEEIENARYGNRCISPVVMDVDARDIGEWHDDHPLNMRGQQEEFRRLFAK